MADKIVYFPRGDCDFPPRAETATGRFGPRWEIPVHRVGEIYFFQLWTPSQATISKINLKSIKSSSIIMASTSLEKWNIHVASFGAGNQIRCQSSVYEFTFWVSQRPEDLRVENFESVLQERK